MDEQKFVEPSDASPCNLMVKFLPDSVSSEETLKELFTPYGQIIKCKLVKDANGQSKGYGFVKFLTEESAAEAMAKMNDQNLESKIIRVSYANAQLNESGLQYANIYVEGIPLSWSKHDLENFFRGFGTITDAKILVDKSNGESKGVGFVTFTTYKDATAAIRATDGTTPDGFSRSLAVRFAKFKGHKHEPRHQNFQNRNFQNHDAGNNGSNAALPLHDRHANHSGFHFSNGADRNGNHSGGRVPRYNNANRNRPALFASSSHSANQANLAYDYSGFAFPAQAQSHFSSFPNAPQASSFPFQRMAPVQNLSSAPVRKPSETDAGLFVFHLPPTLDEQQLTQLFLPFGTVTQAKVIREPGTHRSKGYGFVHFETPAEAQMAINALNGYAIGSKRLKVAFKQNKNPPQ